MAAPDGLADCSITIRLRSTADLASARRRFERELLDAHVERTVVDDLVLACSELLTNALEAAEPGTEVLAVASVTRDPAAEQARRVTLDVVNTGDPLPGRLTVDRSAQLGTRSVRGRGLVVAAQMGDLVVEGLVGGTRARFERTIHA